MQNGILMVESGGKLWNSPCFYNINTLYYIHKHKKERCHMIEFVGTILFLIALMWVIKFLYIWLVVGAVGKTMSLVGDELDKELDKGKARKRHARKHPRKHLD